MKSIHLSSRTNEDWGGKFVDEYSYDVLLDETCTVYKPDGSILLVLLKAAHSSSAMAKAWSVLKGFNPESNNRGLASGTERRKRIRKDGSESNVNIADPVASGIVGFFERTPRFPYCRPCAWNQHNPEKMAQLLPLCQEASSMLARHGGEKYEKQKRYAEHTHRDFLIPETVFSTLTINKNFRTACHKDAGNMADTLNVMTVMREGKFTGANLVLPDFRAAVKLDTGDFIIFDAHEFHGNTPLVQVSKEFTRCSIVYYYRENMNLCGSAEMELNIAKRRQKGDPMFLKGVDDAPA